MNRETARSETKQKAERLPVDTELELEKLLVDGLRLLRQHREGAQPNLSTESEQRIVKSIRVANSLDLAIKRLAFEETQVQGHRVTESDLIELALRQYLESRCIEG